MRGTFDKRLRGLSETEIEKVLKELCEPFGGLKKVTFASTKSGDRLCFVQLTVAENQTHLYSILNGFSFGDSFVVRIPSEREASPVAPSA